MIVGVPKEIKPDEARVGILPSGVGAFTQNGHKVFVERGAGVLSGILDGAYRDAGATIVKDAKRVWDRADMIMKVKEPIGDELKYLRPDLILYTYLHLAGDEALTRRLLDKKVASIGYETVQLDDGTLPLLFPMSEVAGRLSVQKGAQCLEALPGGMGILVGGVSGVKPAEVVIIGGGTVGANACRIAVGMGAHVTVLDIDPAKLRYLHDIMGGHITTVISNTANIGEELLKADLVIGGVLVPGARAPRLITRKHVRAMKPGSAIVDVAIDQGGCAATSKATTHHDPTYIVDGVVHYCVANMPGAVPRTSTFALTNVTLGYGLEIANKGVERAAARNSAIRRGINTLEGRVTHSGVAEAFDMDLHSLE